MDPADQPPIENDEEREEFMKGLSGSIDVFVNRMNSNSARGRSIINDSAVQTLFATLHNMHPQLLKYIQGQEEKRCKCGGEIVKIIFIIILLIIKPSAIHFKI